MVPTPSEVQSRCHPLYPCSSCSGQVPARPRAPTAATAASLGGSHHRCSGSRSRRSARRWSRQSGPLCAGGKQDTPRSEALRLLGVGGEKQMGRTAAKVHGPGCQAVPGRVSAQLRVGNAPRCPRNAPHAALAASPPQPAPLRPLILQLFRRPLGSPVGVQVLRNIDDL